MQLFKRSRYFKAILTSDCTCSRLAYLFHCTPYWTYFSLTEAWAGCEEESCCTWESVRNSSVAMCFTVILSLFPKKVLPKPWVSIWTSIPIRTIVVDLGGLRFLLDWKPDCKLSTSWRLGLRSEVLLWLLCWPADWLTGLHLFLILAQKMDFHIVITDSKWHCFQVHILQPYILL